MRSPPLPLAKTSRLTIRRLGNTLRPGMRTRHTSTRARCLAGCLAPAFGLWLAGVGAAPAEAKTTPRLDLNRDIKPLLSENCFHCHGPDPKSRKAGLRLDTQKGALAAGRSGGAAVQPGEPDKSELFTRITAADPDER